MEFPSQLYPATIKLSTSSHMQTSLPPPQSNLTCYQKQLDWFILPSHPHQRSLSLYMYNNYILYLTSKTGVTSFADLSRTCSMTDQAMHATCCLYNFLVWSHFIHCPRHPSNSQDSWPKWVWVVPTCIIHSNKWCNTYLLKALWAG